MTADLTHPPAETVSARHARGADAGERRCIVTRESGPRGGLIRFVAGPDGEVVPDLAERLPGRGLWLTAERDIVAAAVAKRAFSRAARRPLSAPQDLPDRIEQLLARRCLDLLSMAKRAGLVRAGLEKARAAIDKGRVRLLLTASDSSGVDAADLESRAGRARPAVVCRRLLTRAELGQALGREDAVNVALIEGGLTDSLLRETGRLEGFRAGSAAAQAPAAADAETTKQNSGGGAPPQAND